MDNKYLVCLICCEEFKGGCGGGDLGRIEENVQSLHKFCEVVLKVNNSKGSSDGSKKSLHFMFGGDWEKNEDGLKNKVSKFLRNENDNLSICRDCLDLIKTVTETRLSAKCVEGNVTKMQMLLLRELRRLQGRLDLFWKEFEKMGGTLANGDLKFMETKLNKSYPQVKEDGRKKRGTISKISPEHFQRKNQIFGFRDEIAKVFRDFHQFQSNLIDKIACNPASRTANTTDSSKKMVDAQVQVEIKEKSKQEPVDKRPYHCSKFSSPSTFEEIGDDDQEDGEDDPRNIDHEPMHLDNFDDNDNDDNFSEDNQAKAKPAKFRVSLRCRNDKKKKFVENCSDSDEEGDLPKVGEGDGDGEEYKPEVSKASGKVKKKLIDMRLRVSLPKKIKKTDKEKISDGVEDKQKQNCSDDQDNDDFNPEEEAVNESLSYRAQLKNLFREYEPHLAQMSPFKRDLVKSILKNQFHYGNLQRKKGPENINVYQRHMVHLSYNLETQLIYLKDIPIKITCQSEQENGGNGLICLKCNFKVAESPKMQNLMNDHVLSYHFNAYQCPHCEDKQFGTYAIYRVHVWNCQRGKNEKVSCEICGNSLCDLRALQNHKWRLHMTEDERKEALEKGLVKEYAIKSKKGEEKIFQCEQCGKSFNSPRNLQSHEEVHRDKGSREQIICPKCGKSFLRAGYQYHCKYSVTCGEGSGGDRKMESLACDKCGKGFSNSYLMRRHVREMHGNGDLKRFGCEICGRDFRKKMTLKIHERTHTGEKPWGCGRCGRGFSRSNNMKRHELTCGK